MFRIFILFSIAFISSFAPSLAEEWATYTNEEFKFSIDFYGEPEKTLDTLNFNGNNKPTEHWTSNITDTTHSNSFYDLCIIPLSANFFYNPNSFEEVEKSVLFTYESTFLDNSNTELISHNVFYHGYEGIYHAFKNISNTIIIETWFYFIDNNFYLLTVKSSPHEGFNADSRKFHDSFAIEGVPEGPFLFPQIKKSSFKVQHNSTPFIQNYIYPYFADLIKCRSSIYTAKEDSVIAYFIIEEEYPEDFEFLQNPKKLKQFLNHSIYRFQLNLNGTTISRKSDMYNKIYYREAMIETDRGNILAIVRLYMKNNIMYSLGVLMYKNNSKFEEIDKFFESFEIVEE